MIPDAASLLRVYVNGSDRWQGKALYRAVVETARAMHLAGASVFLVDLSYGTHRRVRDAKSDYLFVEVPVVVEAVDAPERIEALRDRLRAMIADGFATVEPVRLIHYAHHEERPAVVEPEQAPGQESEAMAMEEEAQRVTVYVGSSDTWHGRNLAAAIVECCRTMGIAGATASLGVMGFGKQSRIHRAHLLGLSDDLPERIEIVDHPDRIAELLPVLETMVGGGLIIVENVRAIHYRES